MITNDHWDPTSSSTVSYTSSSTVSYTPIQTVSSTSMLRNNEKMHFLGTLHFWWQTSLQLFHDFHQKQQKTFFFCSKSENMLIFTGFLTTFDENHQKVVNLSATRSATSPESAFFHYLLASVYMIQSRSVYMTQWSSTYMIQSSSTQDHSDHQ